MIVPVTFFNSWIKKTDCYVGSTESGRERVFLLLSLFHFTQAEVLADGLFADGPLAVRELQRQSAHSAAAQSGSAQQHHCMNDSALSRRRETHRARRRCELDLHTTFNRGLFCSHLTDDATDVMLQPPSSLQ